MNRLRLRKYAQTLDGSSKFLGFRISQSLLTYFVIVAHDTTIAFRFPCRTCQTIVLEHLEHYHLSLIVYPFEKPSDSVNCYGMIVSMKYDFLGYFWGISCHLICDVIKFVSNFVGPKLVKL